MPLTAERKIELRDRLSRDPDFREAFKAEARNMYRKALQFNPELEDTISVFEKQMETTPNPSQHVEAEQDEVDLFENILDAYGNQCLMDEKNSSTIN